MKADLLAGAIRFTEAESKTWNQANLPTARGKDLGDQHRLAERARAMVGVPGADGKIAIILADGRRISVLWGDSKSGTLQKRKPLGIKRKD